VEAPEEEMCSAWVRVMFMLSSAVLGGREEGREGGREGGVVRKESTADQREKRAIPTFHPSFPTFLPLSLPTSFQSPPTFGIRLHFNKHLLPHHCL